MARPDAAGPVLLVSTGPFGSMSERMPGSDGGTPGVALWLDDAEGVVDLPANWRSLRPEELVGAAAVRRDFLAFLDRWPLTVRLAGRTFDDAFRVEGRYSLWWTSVGADRQGTHGIFKYFRYAALIDAAMERAAPRSVWLNTPDPILAELVRLRCRGSGCPLGLSSEAPATLTSAAESMPWWLLRTAARGVGSLVRNVLLALKWRWALRPVRTLSTSSRSKVVFASRFDRYLEIRDGELRPLYWKELADALETVAPELERVYMPWRLQTGSQDSSEADGEPTPSFETLHVPLLIRQRFVPLGGQIRSVMRQALLAWRFSRLARQPAFQASFRFAGTDMSPLLLPELTRAISRIAEWSFRRAQFEAALRSVGNVVAVVLSEEMYRPSMPILAAAAALEIPNIGVQHGTLMPAHLVYTLPRGHVRHAPVPDYFAVYGEYAKETVSVHGAYPAERVWVTGAGRLDPLVNEPADGERARTALRLPFDRTVVVLATQTFRWFPSVIRAVMESMRDHPEALLCIKKHPNARAMSVEAMQSLAASIGAEVRIFTGDLELLLWACDVWISASSTTILEATLAEKRSICVNFSGEPDGYPYVEHGASLPARSAAELKESLARALAAPVAGGDRAAREAFLRRHAGPTCEGAAALTFALKLLDVASRSRYPSALEPVLSSAPRREAAPVYVPHGD